jgi:tetratricopeptide (TPR) repeat protein
MTRESFQIDPEFESILRDVAAEPGSLLLRVERPKTVRDFFSRAEPVRASATGLTPEEVQLLVVYRNELAWLLRQAALHELLEGRNTRLVMNRFASGSAGVRVLSPEELAERSMDLDAHRLSSSRKSELRGASPMDELKSSAFASAGCVGEALELLHRCTSRSLETKPCAADLAVASLRLEPTHQARLIASIDLAQSDSPRTALEIAHDVLSGQVTGGEAARAWEYAGAAQVRLGNLDRAFEAYGRACERDPASFLPQMNRLVFAVQLAREADAIESSRRLQELVSAEHPALEWFVQCQWEALNARAWTPSERGRALARKIMDKAGSVGRRIIDVFG